MTIEEFAHRCLLIKAGNAELAIPCCANCEHYKNDIDDVVDSYRCEKWGLIGANTKPEDFCSRFKERNN